MHAEAVPSSIEGIRTDLFELIIWSVFCILLIQTAVFIHTSLLRTTHKFTPHNSDKFHKVGLGKAKSHLIASSTGALAPDTCTH